MPEIAGLEQGDVAGFLVGGYPVLACRTGQDLYAYRDYCPRCTGSMAGAALQRALAGAGGRRPAALPRVPRAFRRPAGRFLP